MENEDRLVARCLREVAKAASPREAMGYVQGGDTEYTRLCTRAAELEAAAKVEKPAPQDDALWLCVPDNSPEYKSKGGHLAPVGFTLAEVREFVRLSKDDWDHDFVRWGELRAKLMGGAR